MYSPWTLKYKPQTLSEVVGNDQAKTKILQWVHQWDKKPPKKRALFLYGPPGTGKTVTVEALANDLDLELVQSNASNYRTADAVERFAGRASQYGTLSGRKRLILFDELDGITGTADRGGLRVIAQIAKNTAYPIVLIANNAYNPRFSTLRKNCQLVEFKRPPQTQVTRLLKGICSREGVEAEEDALKLIAERVNGDVRSAVNDLQALTQGKSRLTFDDVAWLSSRDRKEAIFSTMRKIFYARNLLDARRAADTADVDLDMLFEWIYENLPHHVKDPKELAATMDMLALADIYRGRIGKTQNWTLMRYFIDFMTAGVAASWSRKAPGWVPFRFPSRIRQMSTSRANRAMRSAIGRKIRKRCHISSTRAAKEVIPYLRVIFQNSAEMKTGLAKWLDLDEDMINYLTGKK
ncbi:MAG: replication factor C large subunit [Candidatus Bathyarchaeota archaeon]|nr:replication factor C large subunit [Candidatus Bathyarchaeota archaeon]